MSLPIAFAELGTLSWLCFHAGCEWLGWVWAVLTGLSILAVSLKGVFS